MDSNNFAMMSHDWRRQLINKLCHLTSRMEGQQNNLTTLSPCQDPIIQDRVSSLQTQLNQQWREVESLHKSLIVPGEGTDVSGEHK